MTVHRRFVRATLARSRSSVLSLVALALVAGAPTALSAQNNVLDLRFLELNNHGDVTYQNFIYSRAFGDGKYIAQALYLRVNPPSYNEVAGALGLRLTTVGGADVYALAGIAGATDANYFEPALLVVKTKGAITGSAYLQRYVALSDKGVGQWLLDPLEAQYAIPTTPFAIGASLYAYRPNGDGNSWLTKIGPKVGLNDKWGTSEIRITTVNQNGGQEFQFRRIFVF